MDHAGIRSYEGLRQSLRVKLVDIRENRKVLARAVHLPVGCGYALVAYLELPEDVAQGGFAPLPRALARAAGVGEETVIRDAVKGSAVNREPLLCPIGDMLAGDVSGNLLSGGRMPEDGMPLVLTNSARVLGASVLYYPGMAERIARIVGGDYYVLPSSIHEVLILPDDGRMSAGELAGMVRAVNEHEVSREERLGNRVLRYRRDTGRLQVAADTDKDRGRERS